MDSAEPKPKRHRRARGLLLALGLLVVADQGLHRVVFRDGFMRGVRVAPFDPPLFSEVQFQALERLRAEANGALPADRNTDFDPELGWNLVPGGGNGEHLVDAEGARSDAHADKAERILVYGCSYTYGTEVGAADAWPNLLSERLETTRVVNLGVPGYGVDQAYLRWKSQALPGKEVWLAYLPYASTRVAVQYRPVLRHYSPTVAFKPRFELGPGSELQLRPQPASTRTERLNLVLDASAFVTAVGDTDSYVRDLRAAFLPAGQHWTHHTGIGRAALTMLDRRRPDPIARLLDPEDEAGQVVCAIGSTMAREVAARGMAFRIVVLPSQVGLEQRAQHGTAPWQGIVDTWAKAGIRVEDLSIALDGSQEPASESLWMPGGHYSPLGNARVANELHARLP